MNTPNLPIIITLILYFTGCLKQDNIERAENSLKNGKPEDAANFFKAEINATKKMEKPVDPRLYLNAGLADLEAGNLESAEVALDVALDKNLDDPMLQAKALNGL